MAPELRHAQLLDAALDVLTEGGFDADSVESVAQAAGVTRPVVYHTFGDLEGLMLALMEREEHAAMAPLLEIVGPEPDEETDPERFLVDAIQAFLGAVRTNPRTWRLVLMPPLAQLVRAARADQTKPPPACGPHRDAAGLGTRSARRTRRSRPPVACPDDRCRRARTRRA